MATKRTSNPAKKTSRKAAPEAVAANYEHMLAGLKKRITEARFTTALSVNRELILLYWDVGRDILERQSREGWGAKVIDRLAADLARAFPEMTGLSGRNLKYMRAFAEAWPNPEIVQQVVAQLPWGHNIALLQIEDSETREWYARQTIENGWSRNVLSHQIDSDLFSRKGSALTNFARTLPAPQSELAQEILKDPYSFEFLALEPELLERDLERGLIEHLRALIMELGKGFAFVGSQYHLEVGGQDYYLDLLFYHLRLRCYVVIELKIEAFKPEFAGKMNFYLSAVDAQLRHETDNPTIGIILCKDRNEVIVEYALRDTSKPMGVAKYKVSPTLPPKLRQELPTAEEFSRELPFIGLIRMRIDVERTLRDYIAEQGIKVERAGGVLQMLKILEKNGFAPASSSRLMAGLATMNKVHHGMDIDEDAAKEAIEAGNEFLTALKSAQKK